MWKLLFLTLFLTLSSNVYSTIELGGNFSYQKNTYGSSRENSDVTRTYSGSIAFYPWSLTGIELNASRSRTKSTQNETITLTGTNFSILSQQNIVNTDTFGIGIRQALAGRKSRIRPLLSIGYARQLVSDRTNLTFQNDTTLVQTFREGTESTNREDSVFITFSLQFRILRGLSLNASINSVFPAFDFNRAKDFLKYGVGFTWTL